MFACALKCVFSDRALITLISTGSSLVLSRSPKVLNSIAGQSLTAGAANTRSASFTSSSKHSATCVVVADFACPPTTRFLGSSSSPRLGISPFRRSYEFMCYNCTIFIRPKNLRAAQHFVKTRHTRERKHTHTPFRFNLFSFSALHANMQVV